jgi:hypothetical protein
MEECQGFFLSSEERPYRPQIKDNKFHTVAEVPGPANPAP